MTHLLKNAYIVCLLMLTSIIAQANDVHDIDNQELKNLIQRGVPLVDVRSKSEWKKTGVIDGSHLIMFFDDQGIYNLSSWLEEIEAVADKNEPLALICHSGGRTKQLANYLVNIAGYNEVYNVEKGIVDWIEQDNPVKPIQ